MHDTKNNRSVHVIFQALQEEFAIPKKIDKKWKYLNPITAEITQVDINWYNC